MVQLAVRSWDLLQSRGVFCWAVRQLMWILGGRTQIVRLRVLPNQSCPPLRLRSGSLFSIATVRRHNLDIFASGRLIRTASSLLRMVAGGAHLTGRLYARFLGI